MKSKLLPLLVLAAIPWFVSGQGKETEVDSLALYFKSGLYVPLSYYDSIYITSLPVLELPESYKGSNAPLLPAVVDNSTQPFMRPVYNQAGFSCGQASLVGYNFTYEINYVRNTSADEPENQHPTHFTWNWMNAASNYGGVSYYHSMEVLRHVGDPTVQDYGGMSSGGEKRWMSGYDLYYNAMHNRIRDAYNIQTDTYEGFMTLKHWIHSHLENATAGGVGSFYANQPYLHIFPAGSPEAGKHVCTGWLSSASHALCIVGYNDSIRWDYNEDGYFTNDQDINDDGKVTIKDWEVGGLKLVNSYGGVPNWGDSGYCYTMYKTVADIFGEGGIWNNTVNVLKPKSDCSPQLTMKVSLTYTCRNQIKITAGVSDNVNASVPTYVMSFPIFNFQGGCLYMQGGSTEADKTIEFGLDITPLLNYIQPEQQAKFFLQVEENDPNNWGTGQINSFSLMNYTGAVTEIPCSETNVPILSNAVTRLAVVTAVNYSDVNIQTATLPAATIYEPYSFNLSASGGTTPYEWSLRSEYQEITSSSSFPSVSSEQLIPTNNTTGYAMKALPFGFPFYGDMFDTVYMYVNGFLKFDNYLVTFPCYHDNYTRFLKNRNISPRFDFNVQVYPTYGDGLWYQGDADGATFRWNVSQNGIPSTSDLNFAVKLYPSGKIEFYYGNSTMPSVVEWYAGVTKGDARNYHIPASAGINPMMQNTRIEFIPYPYPLEMAMDTSGNFHGTPEQPYAQYPVTFMATDRNNVSSKKTLAFSTTGIQSTFLVHAGSDQVMEPGDTVTMDVTLKNLWNSAYTGAAMKLTTEDGLVIFTDNTQPVGTIQPGQTLTFPGAFSFLISSAAGDGHTLLMQHTISTVQDTLHRALTLNTYAPVLMPGILAADDGQNDILEPGETADMLLSVHNTGGGKALHLIASMSSADPFITLNKTLDTIGLLPAYSDSAFLFNLTVSPQAPYGHIAYFTLSVAGEPDIALADTLYLIIGEIVENYETGDFTKFSWDFVGQQDWMIESVYPFEGTFSSRSGPIGDSQYSSLLLTMDVLSNAPITFYSKVSSEANYDFLVFMIDGAELGRWAGEVPWTKRTYLVTKGMHTFQWKYIKDVNTVGGSDCAWLDYIIMPPAGEWLLSVYAGPDDSICQGSSCSLDATVFNAYSLLWETSGSGTFSDITVVDPVYTPGPSDINTGMVNLTITGTNDSGMELSDDMHLTISRLPFPFAGLDRITCENEPIAIDAEVTYSDSIYWTTQGDGFFNDPILLDVIYTPGPEDLINGSVNLFLTAYPYVPCTQSKTDTMQLTIQYDPIAFAGEDGLGCEYAPSTLSGDAENAASVLWSSSGDGIFSDPQVLNAIYTPGPQDISLGSVILTLTAFGTAPCMGTDSDDMILTLESGPEVDAGEDQTIQYNTSTVLHGNASGGSGNYSYLWEPEEYLKNPALQNPVTFPLTFPVTFTLTATDIESGCPESDQVTVFIEGSPFTLTVTAMPNPVCTGEPVELFADAQGNTGPFTFSWTSDPPGFTSTLQNPTDTPQVMTTYFVNVTDYLGNIIQGYVFVHLVDPPTCTAGEDMASCYGYPSTLQGQADNFSAVEWHTFGDGSFNNASLLQAVYTPGPADLGAGEARLQIDVTGISPCSVPVTDQVLITYWPETILTFNELPDLCLDDPPFLLTGGLPEGGIYSGTGVEDGYFYPNLAGAGTFVITYTVTDEHSCSFTAEQTILIDECTGTGDPSYQETVRILPNPSHGVFTLQIISSMETNHSVILRNQSGSVAYEQTVMVRRGTNNVPIDLSGLQAGIYLLSVTGDRIHTTRKVVIY
ncbi:MAG: T9SS type A sorting domain-containing protein [Bacteroidales bacterium]|nr:T9SS type A sorting domain-containing protein [Bacteroidales bacterium]